MSGIATIFSQKGLLLEPPYKGESYPQKSAALAMVPRVELLWLGDSPELCPPQMHINFHKLKAHIQAVNQP